MQEFFEGEDVIFENTFFNDKLKNSPVDPTTVNLTLEAPDGVNVAPVVSQNGPRPANVGKYIASWIVDKWGICDWRWETDSPKIVKQGKFRVIQKNIDD
jgi:hypothetical protein